MPNGRGGGGLLPIDFVGATATFNYIIIIIIGSESGCGGGICMWHKSDWE